MRSREITDFQTSYQTIPLDQLSRMRGWDQDASAIYSPDRTLQYYIAHGDTGIGSIQLLQSIGEFDWMNLLGVRIVDTTGVIEVNFELPRQARNPLLGAELHTMAYSSNFNFWTLDQVRQTSVPFKQLLNIQQGYGKLLDAYHCILPSVDCEEILQTVCDNVIRGIFAPPELRSHGQQRVEFS